MIAVADPHRFYRPLFMHGKPALPAQTGIAGQFNLACLTAAVLYLMALQTRKVSPTLQ
jgi:hypothetical protein